MYSTAKRGLGGGPQPAQAPPRCTKCNSPPINGHCTNHRIYNGPLLCGFNVPVKGLNKCLEKQGLNKESRLQISGVCNNYDQQLNKRSEL